jgi:hypothetical protein
MACTHSGFHGTCSRYDPVRELLVYFWVCEECGVRLKEYKRETYKPRFDPQAHRRYLPVGR